jgi:hypothetical protein
MAISRERRFMDSITGKGFHADALGSLTRNIQRCEADRWQFMELSLKQSFGLTVMWVRVLSVVSD